MRVRNTSTVAPTGQVTDPDAVAWQYLVVATVTLGTDQERPFRNDE